MFDKKNTRYYLAICWAISLILVAWAIEIKLTQALFCSVVFLGFTALGHVAVFPIFYQKGSMLDGFIWGSVSGTAIASVFISIIVYLFGWNLTIIFTIIVVLPMLILLYLYWGINGRNQEEALSQNYYHVLLAALTLVTLLIYFPYKNIGVLIEDKYHYAWLFGHDFIIRMVHVDSLSRGIPLKAFFFSGETLSYYWLAYIFPALLRNIDSLGLEIRQLLQITQLYYSLLTTAALILFLRKHVQGKAVLAITIILALCCYSYVWLVTVGIDYLIWFSSNYYPLDINKALINFSGFSHGFYRFFLVEPQSALAIAVILMIFILYKTDINIYESIIVGILIGILFGIEAINGIMIMLWFGGMGLYYLITHQEDRFNIGLKHFISGSCAVVIYIVLFAIEMFSFSTGKGVLQISPNWFALKFAIAYFPLAYGPPLILGIAGLITLSKKRATYDHWIYNYILLLGISLFFVFFIQNPTEYHFGLIKAARVIPICLLMLSVYYLQNRSSKANLGKCVIILIAIAFPSMITDNILASDIKNPSTYVRSADMEAARWIRRNLPEYAIVQAEPNYPGADEKGLLPKYAYSFIPIFAERVTAIGEWKVSSQEHGRPEEVAERFHAIERMYFTESTDECLSILKKYGIEYIYAGELERKKYSTGMDKFKNNQIFEPVYIKEKTSIYRVVK